ncbi:hypothetical protein FB451DRAFT_1194285 [Mycena latifolia]|nr:hypothetical protein FB451DRAFT_1194285 [Mycena latifolia]
MTHTRHSYLQLDAHRLNQARCIEGGGEVSSRLAPNLRRGTEQSATGVQYKAHNAGEEISRRNQSHKQMWSAPVVQLQPTVSQVVLLFPTGVISTTVLHLATRQPASLSCRCYRALRYVWAVWGGFYRCFNTNAASIEMSRSGAAEEFDGSYTSARGEAEREELLCKEQARSKIGGLGSLGIVDADSATAYPSVRGRIPGDTCHRQSGLADLLALCHAKCGPYTSQTSLRSDPPVGTDVPTYADLCRDQPLGRARHTGRPTHLPIGIRQTCAYGGSERSASGAGSEDATVSLRLNP